MERLQEFDFEAQHHQGRSHLNADALSRRHCTQCGRESHTDSELTPISTVNVQDSLGFTTKELQQAQLDDSMVGPLLCSEEIRGQKTNLLGEMDRKHRDSTSSGTN